MPEAPVFRHTYRTFAEAVGLNLRTVKEMESRGEVRAVRFGNNPKKPIVRLEEPQSFLARQGRYSGPEPAPAE